MRTSNRTLRLPAAVVAGLLLASVTLLAHAFPSEPNGWDKHGWGVTLDSAYKSDPGIRENGSLRDMKAALANGNVVLTTQTRFLDKNWATKWYFGPKGLYSVVAKWEDTRMDAHGTHKKVLKKLTSRWGEPKEVGPDGELIWEGRLTRVEARRVRIATGASVEMKLTGKMFGEKSTNSNSAGSNTERSKPSGSKPSGSGSVVDDLLDLPD